MQFDRTTQSNTEIHNYLRTIHIHLGLKVNIKRNKKINNYITFPATPSPMEQTLKLWHTQISPSTKRLTNYGTEIISFDSQATETGPLLPPKLMKNVEPNTDPKQIKKLPSQNFPYNPITQSLVSSF